jgi:hypothetical protein
MAYYGYLAVRRTTLVHPGRVLYGPPLPSGDLYEDKIKNRQLFHRRKKNQNSEGDEFGVSTGHARAMRGALFVLA